MYRMSREQKQTNFETWKNNLQNYHVQNEQRIETNLETWKNNLQKFLWRETNKC